MMEKNKPSLEDLGLNDPPKITNKISIERLQRESEAEIAMARPPKPTPPVNHGLNVGAMLFSMLFPGAGHLLKGKIGEALGWGAAFLFCCFSTPVFWPAALGAVLVYFFGIYSAFKTEPSDSPEF